MSFFACSFASHRLIISPISGQAKEAFLEAESEGTKPQILMTSDYDEAQAFSESVHWI
jgi:virulence-associated protein VagC